MIRIVHTSDLHLDREIFPEDARLRQKRRQEQRALFTDVMMYARDKRADLLFFSGDLLDTVSPDEQTASLILREFESVLSCEIFIAPGSHDPYRPGSFYERTAFPPNVHIFKEEEPTFFEIPRLKTRVYGHAFCGKRKTQRILAEPPKTDPSFFNIFCGYANLHGAKKLCPVSGEEIASSSFDYLAFGGEHDPSALLFAGGSYYAMSGSPESIGFDDPGEKSIRIAAMDRDGDRLLFQSKCVKIARKRFLTYDLQAEGKTPGELSGELYDRMREDGVDDDCYVRARLKGRVLYTARFGREDFERPAARCASFFLVDDTTFVYEPEEESGQARQVFASLAAERIKDEKELSNVLKIGIEAFDGK